MGKVLTIILMLSLMIFVSPVPTKAAEHGDLIMDMDYFLREFLKAKEANDEKKKVVIVRRAESIVCETVMAGILLGIEEKEKGGDDALYFNFAEEICQVYATEFNKGVLLELVKSYRNYTQEMCKQKITAHALIDEGKSFKKQAQWKEALVKYTEALRLFDILGDIYGREVIYKEIGDVYGHLGRNKEALNYYQKGLEIARRIGDVLGEAESLKNIGITYDNLGEYIEALNFYEKALKISIKIGDFYEAMILNNAGVVYEVLGKSSQAMTYYEKALTIFRKIRNLRGEASALNNMGNMYQHTGQYSLSLNCLKRAAEISNQIGDVATEAKGWNNMGVVYKDTGEYIEALNHHQKALTIFRKVKDEGEEAKALINIGIIYEYLGETAKALHCYRDALEITQKIGDNTTEAKALGNMGNIYINLGQYSKALSYFQQGLEISQKINDLNTEALFLKQIGIIYSRFGQYREALNYQEKAFNIFPRTGDAKGKVGVLIDIGNVHSYLGQYTKAIDHYLQALEIAKKIGVPSEEAAILGNIGSIYIAVGRYTEALDYLHRSLEIFQKIKYVEAEASAILNIGNIWSNLGQYSKALNFYQEALEIFRKMHDTRGEATTLNNIGIVYDKLGRPDDAIKSQQRSLEISQSMGDSAMEASALLNLSVNLEALGKYLEALNHLEKALEIFRKIKFIEGEASALVNIGLANYRLGQNTEAIKVLQESIKISKELGNPETVWRGYRGLGLAFRKSSRGEEAVVYYKEAMKAIEEIYHYTKGFMEEERSSMIGEKHFVYQEFIELLLELHRKSPDKGYDKQAFTIAEKSKSRTFQELMAKAGAKTAFSEEAKDETFKKMIEKEQQLIIEIPNHRTLLTKELSKPEKAQNQGVIASLKEQLSKTEKTLEEHEKEIDTKYPRYADLKRPKSLTVEELQEILNPGETILAYAVGRDKTVAFVIAKGRFKMVELSVSPTDLAQLLKQFRKGLEGIYEPKDLEQFDPEIAFTLYQQLIAPLASEFRGVTKLYIAADNILYTLPFEALVDQEVNKQTFREARRQSRSGQGAYLGEYATLHYLVDTYTITYLPSASVLRSLRKYEKPGYGKWNKPLIAFADPIFGSEEKVEDQKGVQSKGISKETDLTVQILTRSTGNEKLERLKESAQEAETISKELKGKKEDIYLRERATEQNVYKTNLKESRYLLFSTHGLLGGDFTGVAEPALVLTLIGNPPGRDGFLTMSKVLGLDLNSELVILSACNTSGKGDKSGAGEGFVGLTRSFMYAGTRSILVTHWSVESQAARDLMVATFKNKQKESGPDALRSAKLEMKGSTRQMGKEKLSLSHPFFWAPFVLVGEGK